MKPALAPVPVVSRVASWVRGTFPWPWTVEVALSKYVVTVLLIAGDRTAPPTKQTLQYVPKVSRRAARARARASAVPRRDIWSLLAISFRAPMAPPPNFVGRLLGT